MSFLELLQARPAVGVVATIPSLTVVELLSTSGYDWIWIDMEHAPIELSMVQAMLQVLGSNCHGVVRIPDSSETWIKRALDLGVSGLIVPQVNSAADLMRITRAAKYPPEGDRSVGIGRAQGYGRTFAEYVSTANQSVPIIAQVESREAVERIQDILSVPGLDAILLGPYDLSGSLGLLGQVESPAVEEAVTRVREECVARKIPVGIFESTPLRASMRLREGFQFVAVGIDAMLLRAAAEGRLAEMRRI